MSRFAFIFILLGSFCKAQNLVPNWSFETYTVCPNASGQLPSATPWTAPTNNSGDYYNSCSSSYNVPNYLGGYQKAKEGSAFAAIWCTQMNGTGSSSNYREYLQVQLNDTLTTFKCYYVEFFVNLYEYSRYGINNISANLDKNKYLTTGTGFVLNLPPHIMCYGNPVIKDTINWVKISGTYNSGGGEKYLTIGNFKNDNNTDTTSAIKNSIGSYFFFDAVSVYSINPTGVLPWQYRDTTVAIGDSVYIGNTMGGTFTSNWFTYGGSFISSGSGLYVKPVTTSTYVVQFTVCGVPRSDTLKVTVTGVGIDELKTKNSEFRIVPNPNNGTFELQILNNEFILRDEEIRILNVLGQEIRKEKLLSKKQKIILEGPESGFYILQIINDNSLIFSQRLIITK